MTNEEKRIYSRAYSRGYAAGRRGCWPPHCPPLPPDSPLVAELLRAAKALRDQVDAMIRGLDPDDPWCLDLDPVIDAYDRAARAVTEAVTREVSEGKQNGD